MRARYLIVHIVISLLNCHGVLTEIPNCAFEHTVNLTASHKHPNGSYSYGDVLVPPHLIGYYDYTELFGGVRETVKTHLRGCVCKLKHCVKFCCHPRAKMSQLSKTLPLQCATRLWKSLNYSPFVNITLPNGRQRETNVLNEFVVQQGIPCDKANMLMPHLYVEDRWELFENGTLLRVTDRLLLTTRDYCMYAYPVNGINVLNPIDCFSSPVEKPQAIIVNTIIMLISAPFLYATILIYWLTGKLRSLNGKILICYLFSLANGTLLIVVVNLRDTEYGNTACAAIGFVAYYFLTSVFFWLNVICFDLWQHVGSTKRAIRNYTSQQKRFLHYSLYAWGLPAIMTFITVCLQYSDISDKLKSGIGVTHCWLKTDDWSAMMYFHGPCLLLGGFNIVIFYLTAKQIFSVRSELQKLTQTEDHMNQLRLLQNNIWVFCRLFVIMGISWLLEIFAYLLDNKKEYDFFFAIVNAFNSLQGFILFILLVMTKKNIKIVMKAINIKFSKMRF